MKPWGLWFLALTSLGMSGCTMLAPGSAAPARKVTVGGESYVVTQITESTWTASATGNQKILSETSGMTASLQQAVEMVSGCRVTDTNYSRQGKQFDAQVSCGSHLSD